MKKTYAPLGSISSGTHRLEDLIPCFLSVLDSLRESDPDATDEDSVLGTIGEIEGRIESSEDYFDSEDAQDDYMTLCDLLEAYAPPGAHFGAHEGDGADFGFWPDSTPDEDEPAVTHRELIVNFLQAIAIQAVQLQSQDFNRAAFATDPVAEFVAELRRIDAFLSEMLDQEETHES